MEDQSLGPTGKPAERQTGTKTRTFMLEVVMRRTGDRKRVTIAKRSARWCAGGYPKLVAPLAMRRYVSVAVGCVQSSGSTSYILNMIGTAHSEFSLRGMQNVGRWVLSGE